MLLALLAIQSNGAIVVSRPGGQPTAGRSEQFRTGSLYGQWTTGDELWNKRHCN